MMSKGACSPDASKRCGSTALHASAESGCVPVVQLLLDVNAKVDPANVYGETPLGLACKAGHPDVTALLLTGGAKPNLASFQGMSPLMRACAGTLDGHYRCAQILLEHGASPDLTLLDGRRTALLESARVGHIRFVELLLANGATADPPIDGATSASEATPTPLAAASGQGHVLCAIALLKAGAACNRPGQNEMTPLMAASCANSCRVAEALIQHGADIDHRSPSAGSALLLACLRGHARMAHLLSRRQATRTPIHTATTSTACDTTDPAPSWILSTSTEEEDAARSMGFRRLGTWLQRTRGWTSPLHFLASLSEAETVALLQGGAYLGGFSDQGEGYVRSGGQSFDAFPEESQFWVESDGVDGAVAVMQIEAETECEEDDDEEEIDGNLLLRERFNCPDATATFSLPPLRLRHSKSPTVVVTPAERAAILCARPTPHTVPAAVLCLVLQAAAPWSPTSHWLWPRPARERVKALLCIGYSLAWAKGLGAHLTQPGALADLWVRLVLPMSMRRSDST